MTLRDNKYTKATETEKPSLTGSILLYGGWEIIGRGTGTWVVEGCYTLVEGVALEC